MKNNCFSKRVPLQAQIYSPHQAHSVEKVVVDGRIVSRSVFVIDDPRETYRDVKAENYFLENLLDAGSDLKRCTLSASAFTAVASMPIMNDSNLPKSVEHGDDSAKS